MAPAYPPPLLLGPSSAVAPEAEAFIQKEKVVCGLSEGQCRINAIIAFILTIILTLIILVIYGCIAIGN
jgi:hypothetical protein